LTFTSFEADVRLD